MKIELQAYVFFAAIFCTFCLQKTDGLQAGQFYSADCNDGDVRTIARNPLCAYSEVHNVTFVKNEKFDTWFSPCRELIYFNQQSDILALMSSADTDGDACTVIDNEIIQNAVVVPKDGKYFINTDDGQTKLMKLDFTNRFFATFQASGNLIGSISLKAANINSKSQETLDFYNTVNDKFFLFNEIDIEDEEERTKYIKGKLDSEEWLTTYHSSDRHREYIRQRFYENEKDIYIVLYNAMVSIDAPKTLYFPSADDMKVINDKYYKKARFLQYRENKENVKVDEYKYTFGLLDDFAGIIEKELLRNIQEVKKKFDNRADIIQEKLVNGDYPVETYNECAEAVESLYLSYTNERQAVNNESRSKMSKLIRDRKETEERYGWDEFREEDYQATVSEIKAEKWDKYKEIDAKFVPLADEIMEKYELAAIANAIGTMKNCTEDFIINLFYLLFQYLNEKLQNKRFVYKKDENGDISFLGERYTKVSAGFVDNANIIKKQQIDEKKRLKLISVKADIRARVLDADVIALIETELNDKKNIFFDIHVTEDSKVILKKDGQELLEVFKDWLQINEYNLMSSSSVKVELLVDVASTRKSLKLTVTEITI